jgi:hypothetical protein
MNSNPRTSFGSSLLLKSQKTKSMIAKTDLAKLYETLLTIPGMNQSAKINLKMPLRNALVLSKIIERGLQGKDADTNTPSLLDFIPLELTLELQDIPKEILHKTGLQEMNEKLREFVGK